MEIMEELVDQGYNPLVLNMANHLTPGGGVRNGAHAQEEQIFKVTNAFRTLTADMYPIEDNELIYTPKVHHIKDSLYRVLDSTRTFSLVTVAALRNPVLTIDGKYTDAQYQIMLTKIRMIFHIAALNNHDTLVLGAFGCGAFSNPPDEVVRIFLHAIGEYGAYFQGILFAVKSGQYNSNFRIFYRGIIGLSPQLQDCMPASCGRRSPVSPAYRDLGDFWRDNSTENDSYDDDSSIENFHGVEDDPDYVDTGELEDDLYFSRLDEPETEVEQTLFTYI
jgi:hypothetical protein